MELQSAKKKFIQDWGVLCSNWGVNKTMGHIHALMLVSSRILCADEIMKELQILKKDTGQVIAKITMKPKKTLMRCLR